MTASAARRLAALAGFALAGAVAVVVAAVALLHVPSVQTALRVRLAREAGRALSADVEARELWWDLFRGTLVVEEASVRGRDARAGTSVSVRRIRIRFRPGELLQGRVRIVEAGIDDPAVRLRFDTEGRLVLPFVVPAPGKKRSSSPDLTIAALRLTGGRVEIDDDGPSRRRIDASGLSISGGADLSAAATKGTFAVERLLLSAAGRTPLDGTTIRASWETSGETGRVEARAEGKETGLVLALTGSLSGLGKSPRYEAVLKATGSLEPLAARLVPSWSLSGTIDAEAAARGTFAALPDVRVKAGIDGLTAHGRSVARLDLAGELAGTRLAAATAVATDGRGSARVEASGTLFPAVKDLSFRGRLDAVDLDRLTGPLPGNRRVRGLVSGSVEGRLSSPTLAGTSASADLTFAPAGSAAPGAAPAGRAVARIDRGVVTVERLTLHDRGTQADAAGSWDLGRAAFEGRLDVDSSDLAPWLALAGLSGSGNASVHLSGGGTLERPALEGCARARALVVGGVRVDSLSFDARLAGPEVEVSNGAVAAYGAEAQVAGSGLLPSKRGKAPEADLRLSGLAIRGRRLPDLAAHARFGTTVEGRLASSDGRVNALASLGPDGTLRAEATADRLDLSPFAALLPAPWSGATGEMTGLGSAERKGKGPLLASLRVEKLSAALEGRRLVTRLPAEAIVDGKSVRIPSLSIEGDDGSAFSLSGSAALDGSALDLSTKAAVPALAAWASLVPDGKGIAGTLSADLRVTGSLRRPLARGRVSGEALSCRDFHIEKADLSFEPVPGREGATAIRLSHAGARKGDLPFPDATAEGLLEGGALAVTARALEGRIRLSGSVSLAAPWPVTAEATLDAVELGGGPISKAAGVPKGIGAVVTGRVTARGPLSRPELLEVDVVADRLEISGPQARVSAREPVRLSLTRDRLELRSLHLSGGSVSLDAEGALPRDRSASGRLRVRGDFDLAAILPFVPFLDRAQGKVDATLEAAGSLSDPSLSGRVELSGGLLDGPDFPVPLEGMAGVVTATGTGLELESLTARIGGGTASLSGSLGMDGIRPRRLEAALRARDVDLSIGDDVQVRAGADLTAGGTWPALSLKGEVRIADATYTPAVELAGMLQSLVARKAPAEAARPARRKEPSAITVALDIAVMAQDAIHLDGQMADVEMGGNVHVRGTLDAPIVLGNVTATRGTFNLLGTSFDLSRARIVFSEPDRIDPELDVVATTTKGDDEITVRISGHASKAQLTFSSTSGKSQADVVKELFGGSGDGGANALAASSARLAMAGVASPLASAIGTQTSFHIVPLPTTAEGEEFLFSVGKDLGGGLVVTYYKGLSGETSDAFEARWRLSSVGRGRVRQNQDGSISGGFRIRHEFH